MSILSVDNISPIGSGTSVTVNSAATLVLNNVNSTGVTTASGGVRVNADGSTAANYISVGASDDLKLYHQGGNSIIQNSTGYLELNANAAAWIKTTQFNIIDNDATHYHIRTFKDDRVELFHNNSKKFETTDSGVKVTDAILEIADTTCLIDLMETSATNHRIRNGNGNFHIQKLSDDKNTATNQLVIDGGTGETALYYAGNKKFETTNTGATITGDLYTTSRLLVNTTSPGESNGDEATFANPSGNAGITIRSAVNNECKIYFSEGTSGGSQYRGAINYNQNTNYMAFSANEYERMRITSDGTLQLTYYNQNTGRGRILFGSSAPAFIEGYDTGNAGSGAYLKFGTNGTDRMRIDNSGHTFFSGMTNLTASGSNKGINMENSTNNGRMNIHANSSAGNALGISFYNNGANVGTIYYGTSSTAYNTSSDYRLKENKVSISDGIARLKNLKPCRFNFKVDPTKTVDGFFAHEVAPIIPEAVTGEKDAEDMQQLDYSKLTPLLTAALQEAITEIETLKAKVAALEGS